MNSPPPTPPGYEGRRLPRTVRPNVQKIEALLRQKNWSEQYFAKLCGRGDAGFFRHWKKPDATAYIRTLVRAAKTLGLRNWWDLWEDYVPPPPKIVARSENEGLIERLSVSTLLDPTVGFSAMGHPSGTQDFLEQLKTKFPEETAAVASDTEAFTRVFRNLVEMGWLDDHEDGSFTKRYWTLRECTASIESRCGAEAGAILAVAMLLDPDQPGAKQNFEIYERIVEDQQARLKVLKHDHMAIVQTRDEDAAVNTVRNDDAFHRGWTYAPCTNTSLGFALTTIDQSTNRFVETLKRCREREIAVPADFPTLPQLVEKYYPQLDAIFAKFLTIKPNDMEGIVVIYQMLRNHALDGFKTARRAESLIERWPRCPNAIKQ